MRRVAAFLLLACLWSASASAQAVVSSGGGALPSPGAEGNVLTSVSGVWASATPGGAGLGDASTNTSSSVANVLVCFANTGGKLLKSCATSLTGGASSAMTLGASATFTLGASSGLSVAAGKIATFSNTLTFTGTDSSSVNVGAGGVVAYTGADINTSGQVISVHFGSPLGVVPGGTGLASGTSGGVLCFTGSTTMASSSALTANRLLLGGGAGACPGFAGSLGSTTTVLHGGAAAPTFGPVTPSDASGIWTSGIGGTGNGFTKFTGPAASEKSFALPNASATILTDNTPVTVPQGGCGTTTLTANGVLYGNGTSPCGATTVGTSGQVLTSRGVGLSPTFQTLMAGGTVTSIDMTVPSFLAVANNPITSSGSLDITLANQTAAKVFASPASSTGAPSFQSLTAAFFPTGFTETVKTTGSTITEYGVSWAVKCPTACTQVLPTVAAHTGDTEAFCIDDDSAPVTLDGASSETINGATTRIMIGGECANLRVRDGEWKKMSGHSIPMVVRLSSAAGQDLASGNWRTLTMDTVKFGYSLMFDSMNGRAVALRLGYYSVTGGTFLDASDADLVYYGVSKNNSSPAIDAMYVTGVSGYTTELFVADAGDYFNVHVFPSTGVTTHSRTDSGVITITEISPW